MEQKCGLGGICDDINLIIDSKDKKTVGVICYNDACIDFPNDETTMKSKCTDIIEKMYDRCIYGKVFWKDNLEVE